MTWHRVPAAGSVAAVIVTALLLGACADSTVSPAASVSGASPSQALDSPQPSAAESLSAEGGDPRTSGYWEMWSSCGDNSQAAMAAANGGREAGWIIADDLLLDPGIEVGPLSVQTCEQGLALLHRTGSDGGDHSADPAYELAAQLYTAELNVAAGARGCDALQGAVIAGSAILTELEFDGSRPFIGSVGNPDFVAQVTNIASQLALYNGGGLC